MCLCLSEKKISPPNSLPLVKTLLVVSLGLLGVDASGSVPSSPSAGVVQVLNLNDRGHLNPLNDELGDPVPLRDYKVLVGKVEKDDAYLPPVVGVYNAGAYVDELLDGQARPRGDPSVSHGRASDGQTSLDDGLPFAGDDGVDRR